MPTITGEITGHKKVAKTLRTIHGRFGKPNKTLFAEIGARMVGNMQQNITAKDIFLKKPHKDRVRGQLFSSIKILKNTGKQVLVGPGDGGFFGTFVHFGTEVRGKRRHEPKEWAFISDALIDWATGKIGDHAAGVDLE